MTTATITVEPTACWLTPARLDTLRGALQQRRSFRLEQLTALDRELNSGHTPPAIAEVTRTLAAAAQRALGEIFDAIERIDRGAYGRCRDCCAPLPFERLEVLPQLSRCPACHRHTEAPVD